MWVRQGLYGLFLAFVVALPSALMLGYATIKGDPTLRPFAQSIEDVVFGNQVGEGRLLQVYLRLHAPEPDKARRMARQIQAAFLAKGIESRIYIVDTPPGAPAGILFEVRSNKIGPFPLSRASEGIKAAVSAYRMNGGEAPGGS